MQQDLGYLSKTRHNLVKIFLFLKKAICYLTFIYYFNKVTPKIPIFIKDVFFVTTVSILCAVFIMPNLLTVSVKLLSFNFGIFVPTIDNTFESNQNLCACQSIWNQLLILKFKTFCRLKHFSRYFDCDIALLSTKCHWILHRVLVLREKIFLLSMYGI